MNITLIGMPGSGKSYIGALLARDLGYKLVELDQIMEETYQKPLQEILETLGEPTFLLEQEEDAIAQTKHFDSIVISPGGSIIYSPKAMTHLKSISKVVYLETSLETIQARINEIPRGIVGLRDKTLAELYAERTQLYAKWADFVVNAETTPDQVLSAIRKLTTPAD